MRLADDNIISLKRPYLGGSFAGHDRFPTPGDLKLEKVQICLSPLRLELSFEGHGRVYMGLIEVRENTGAEQSRLEEYQREIEASLLRKNWDDVVRWDFKFDEATRLDR